MVRNYTGLDLYFGKRKIENRPLYLAMMCEIEGA